MNRIILLFFTLAVSPLWSESWTVGERVFQDVEVREVKPDTVVFLHRGGLSSLPLATLPDALQDRFGYDADKARAYREAQAEKIAAARKQSEARKQALKKQAKSAHPAKENRLEQVLSQLNEPLFLAKKVDLRDRFREHGLHPRNQGRRPSCSIFAVSSALGFALAENGYSGQLSEEYLLWSTLEYLKRHPAEVNSMPSDGAEPGDAGFSLMSVVQAAQWYGAALQSEMPNRLGGRYAELKAPPESLIERSRERRLLRAARLTGKDREQRINYIIKVLNAGWPVSIGTRWPSAYVLRRTPLIDRQEPLPDYAHAITLVGYTTKSNDLDSCLFIFRNSWGVRWGIAGHGLISRDYLLEHLVDAIVIDVEPKT
ncbi:MAG: hypothetical protein GVY36_06695 [Verrucomicrobia bacterium]|nr:hypothetical protein [Verrucomicrobiota bacterium]